MTISEKLLSLRRKKGLSQEQLAEMLDVSWQSVSQWEAKQSLPEPSKLILISELFGVSIDQLLNDDLSVEQVITIETEKEAKLIETAPAAIELEVMFCTKCGRENCANSVFCGYCGNPFISFVAAKPETREMSSTDMDLAYYKANMQMQQQELEETRRQTELQRQQLRLQRKQYDETVKCPRCGSTSLSSNKKGMVGMPTIAVGHFALTIVNIGAGKVRVTCMNCGYQFKAGKTYRRMER